MESILNELKRNSISMFKDITNFDMTYTINSFKASLTDKQDLFQYFNALVKSYPEAAFLLVYDLEEYKEFCLTYLNKDYSILLNDRVFHNFLGSTEWSVKYVKEHLEELILKKPDLAFSVLRYGICFPDEAWLREVLYHENLEIRGYFMLELIDNFHNSFFEYYPNVLDYLTKVDENGKVIDKISEPLVSKLAYFMMSQMMDVKTFYTLKEFIFANYDKNILASLLNGYGTPMSIYGPGDNYDFLIEEDATRFFVTSKNYKYRLYKNKEFVIDEEIRNDFACKIERFAKIDDEVIDHIFLCGLGDKFLEYVSSYMEKSTGSHLVQDLGRGSTTRSFRIGDYVVKCSLRKWEKTECPDIYLFAKCYEKDYVKDNFGRITGGLEVQKFYSQVVTLEEKEIINCFYNSLKEAGYEIWDRLVGMNNTYNLFHLDSYEDADIDDYTKLPEWFKKDPVVWVDRDLVHKL